MDFLGELYDQGLADDANPPEAEAVIFKVLEFGTGYRKARDTKKSLKRKRDELDEEAEEFRKYNSEERGEMPHGYRAEA